MLLSPLLTGQHPQCITLPKPSRNENCTQLSTADVDRLLNCHVLKVVKYTFPQFSICKWSRSLKVGQAGEILDGFPLPNAALPVPRVRGRNITTAGVWLLWREHYPPRQPCQQTAFAKRSQGSMQQWTQRREGVERGVQRRTDVRWCAERFKGNSSCPVSGFVDGSSNWSPPRTWATTEKYHLAHNSSLQTQQHIGSLLICSIFLDV